MHFWYMYNQQYFGRKHCAEFDMVFQSSSSCCHWIFAVSYKKCIKFCASMMHYKLVNMHRLLLVRLLALCSITSLHKLRKLVHVMYYVMHRYTMCLLEDKGSSMRVLRVNMFLGWHAAWQFRDPKLWVTSNEAVLSSWCIILRMLYCHFVNGLWTVQFFLVGPFDATLMVWATALSLLLAASAANTFYFYESPQILC